MNKIQPTINERLDKQHTHRIIGTVIHDMILEEAYEIYKKVPKINLRKLKAVASKKVKLMYHDILDENISVAYKKDE